MTYTPIEFRRVLKNNGYTPVSGRGKGSHTIYKNGNRTISVGNNYNKMVIRRLIKEYELQV